MMPCEFAVPIIHLEQTDSTNNYLLDLSKDIQLQEFSSVIADYQTTGKGQRGNTWVSEKGKNLLFSFICYPDFIEARKQFYLSKIISLAIRETLELYTTNITIKWPNDIYWKDKKICGTLIENSLMGTQIQQSIAGIGVNLNQETFDSSAPNPVSLYNITHSTFDLMDIYNSIMKHFRLYYGLLKESKENVIDQLYHNALYRKEGFHEYEDDNGTFKARIDKVLPEGNLVLIDKAGNSREYAFKEVRYLMGLE